MPLPGWVTWARIAGCEVGPALTACLLDRSPDLKVQLAFSAVSPKMISLRTCTSGAVLCMFFLLIKPWNFTVRRHVQDCLGHLCHCIDRVSESRRSDTAGPVAMEVHEKSDHRHVRCLQYARQNLSIVMLLSHSGVTK